MELNLSLQIWALSTTPASPDTALLPQERGKLAGDGGRGQRVLSSPDNAAPRIVCWRTSKFYQFALQILCRSFPLCISSNCYTLAHPFPGMMWLREMRQMLSSWDTLLCILAALLSILIEQETHRNISNIYSNFHRGPSRLETHHSTFHLQESDNKYSTLPFSSRACSVMTITTFTLPCSKEAAGMVSSLCYPPGWGLGGLHSHIPVSRGHLSYSRTLAFS